jgi:hypothetical protein
MPNPHLQGWFAVTVPKAGSAAAENEDAVGGDVKRVRFAISDGASEGWQSRGWANHLVQAYLAQPPAPPEFDRWLAAVRKKWQPPEPRSDAWYAEVKQEQGSFATLLGLEFRAATDPPGLVWKAVAVGDSCLFQVRGDVFPLTSVEQFGNHPPLVPSSTDQPCPEPEWLAGWTEPGDLFVMATDAVARFILSFDKPFAENPVLRAARDGVASGASTAMVQLLNEMRATLNDDASVLAVRVAER